MSRFNDEETIELSLNYHNLRRATARLKSLKTNNPDSSEIARMEFVISDLEPKLTPEEKEHFQKVVNKVKTAAEIASELTEFEKSMEANVDKPSI